MRVTYDTEVDALTIVVTREPVERTVDLGEGRFVDVDEDGNIVALEILDVSNGIQLRDLVERFDLKPLMDAFDEYVRTAQSLTEDDDLREALAR